jgi:hypothetical protein
MAESFLAALKSNPPPRTVYPARSTPDGTWLATSNSGIVKKVGSTQVQLQDPTRGTDESTNEQEAT